VQRCLYDDREMQFGDGCLLMFTDGLVERREQSLEVRLAALDASLRAAPNTDPDALAKFVIEEMTADGRCADDVVLLTACRADGDSDCPG
jgi:hypothetical protein